MKAYYEYKFASQLQVLQVAYSEYVLCSNIKFLFLHLAESNSTNTLVT